MSKTFIKSLDRPTDLGQGVFKHIIDGRHAGFQVSLNFSSTILNLV